MTEIILMRHGETEWNVGEIFRGRADIELNETGTQQAKLLAGYLRDTRIEAVYSSPLKRAVKTAEAIAAEHKLKVEISPELSDMDFGSWQGLPLKEVGEKYPELYAEWLNHPEQLKLPGGETLDDVRKRALGLVNKVIAGRRGAVVLVSHRVVNKVLICALLGLDNTHFWNIRVDTCGVTIFDYDAQHFVLARHNDVSFLKPLQKAPLRDF